MMAPKIRALALAGALAGTTLIAAPASAAPVPSGPALGAPSAAFDHSRFDPATATADWRCRWNCGYGGYRGYRRNRVDAGDVLIGAAIIGGIAAIIGSENRRQRDRDVVIVERDPRDWDRNRDYRYDRRDDRQPSLRGTGASGLDNAVDQCVTRIERDVRVDSVDNVERTGAGWRVTGVLFDGSAFQCRIGNSGQIDGIDYGDGFSSAPSNSYLGREEVQPRADSLLYLGREEAQWSDQQYADARAALGSAGAPAVQSSEQPLPAYPGGPIPGEDIPETIDGEL